MSRPADPLPSQPDAEEQLDLGAVQVVDIVANVVRDLDGAGQRVQMVMERAPTVVADSGKLAEITSTLLQNALDASSADGPIEVEVSARCLAPDHEGRTEPRREECEASVSVAIRDRSSDSGTDQQADGMLRNAHQIIQLHKGRLWYAAETAQGRTTGYCLNSERAA